MSLKRFIISVSICLGGLSATFVMATSRLLNSTAGTAAVKHHEVAVGDEFSSVPASITEYIASRHRPEAKPSDDYKGYAVTLCDSPAFTCTPVSSRQTWSGFFHSAHRREVIMRLNRTNVALKYRKWIVKPKHLRAIDYMALSPMPEKIQRRGHRLLLVDLNVFAFGAYDKHGDLVYWGPASGGKKYCKDTGENCQTAFGDFKIFRMRGENCTSSKYPLDTKGGAPMPYCMYYHKGFAIHGSTLSGFVNRSRGCVRVFYNDAKWLNKDFVKLGTEVIVKG